MMALVMLGVVIGFVGGWLLGWVGGRLVGLSEGGTRARVRPREMAAVSRVRGVDHLQQDSMAGWSDPPPSLTGHISALVHKNADAHRVNSSRGEW